MSREQLQQMLAMSKTAAQKHQQEEQQESEPEHHEEPAPENTGPDTEAAVIPTETPPAQPTEVVLDEHPEEAPVEDKPAAPATPAPAGAGNGAAWYQGGQDQGRKGLCSQVTTKGDFCRNKAVKDGKCALHSK